MTVTAVKRRLVVVWSMMVNRSVVWLVTARAPTRRIMSGALVTGVVKGPSVFSCEVSHWFFPPLAFLEYLSELLGHVVMVEVVVTGSAFVVGWVVATSTLVAGVMVFHHLVKELGKMLAGFLARATLAVCFVVRATFFGLVFIRS